MAILDILKRKKERDIDFQLKEKISGDIENFKRRLKKSSLIILITGKRGSGKTALGLKFLELISGKRKAYYLGKAKLPGYIKKVQNLKEVKNNSLLLIDEAAISYSSRDSMKTANKILKNIMVIARHKNLTLIIVTQSSAMIDLNIMRLTDTVIIKEPSLLQARFERKSILDLFKKAEEHFKKIKSEERVRHFYIIDDELEGMLSFSLPEFWSERISKSFSKS